METTVLMKENGIWKYGDTKAIYEFVQIHIPTFDFTRLNTKPIIHIESTVNSSGTRIYKKL